MPTSKLEYGSYFYETRTEQSDCGFIPQYDSSNGIYVKRTSSGETGKGSGSTPRFNAYSATFRQREVGRISVSATVRDWYAQPCNSSILAPFSHHFEKVDTYADFALPSSISDQGMRQCFNKFVDRLNNAQQSLQALVSVGEARETFRMVKSPLRDLVGLTTKYVNKAYWKANGMKKLRAAPKEIAQALNAAYLEYTFGVKPLLSDIKGTTKAFYNQRDAYSQIKRVSARFTERTSAPSSDTSSWGSQYVGGFRTLNADYESRIQYIAYVSASSPVSPGESPFLKDLGLTISDFVPSLYELVPWSFVLDYFVDIGGYLNRQKAVARNGSVAVCRTLSSSATTSADPRTYQYPADIPQTPGPQAGVYAVQSNHSTGSCRVVNVDRSVSQLQFALPPTVGPAHYPSLSQDLNLASLFAAFKLSGQTHPLTSNQRRLFGIN